jgi:hypothetical protein
LVWQEQFELLAASLTDLEAGQRAASASRAASPRRSGKSERGVVGAGRGARPRPRTTKPR